MQKSTPLDHLRRDDQEDGGAQQMMDSVVRDLDDRGPPPGYPPQEMMDPRIPGPEHFHSGPPQQLQQLQQQQPPPGYGGPIPMPNGRMPYGMPPPGMGMGLENESFAQKLLGQAKEPMLVALLAFILSTGQVQQLTTKIVPIAGANPMIGLVIRAAIAGVAFYLLRRFIP